MSIFDIFLRKTQKEQKTMQKRSFVGAVKTRFTDWISATFSKPNADLINQQTILLPRCRDLAKNNPVIRAYLGMAVKNVIGKSGITLQSQLKKGDNSLDEEFNDKLEWRLV